MKNVQMVKMFTFSHQVLRESKYQLLHCAAPDAVVRLEHTDLPPEEKTDLLQEYWDVQRHNSLHDFIQQNVITGEHSILAQVTIADLIVM